MVDVVSQSTPSARPAARGAPAHWFSDLSFSWAGIHDRRTGRMITTRELTPAELFKFIGYFAVVLVQSMRAAPGPRIYFTPERPPPWYVAWSAMVLSGCRFARTASEADALFYFEDRTHASRPPPRNEAGINGACRDISKSRVASIFEDVFGYPLALDPQSWDGVAVEKSEENGVHDGRLIQCPALPIAGKTYQRFIDASDETHAVDFRTAIINRTPLYVLRKKKPLDARFSIHNQSVALFDLSQAYSEAEIGLIMRFAEAMALDCGAIDVLRDRVSGRLYIVDVNKTDTGPPVDLSWSDRAKLKRKIATAFLAMAKERAGLP